MAGWMDANIYAWLRPRSGRGLPPKWKRVLSVLTVSHRTQKKASHRSYYTELNTCLGQRGPAARSLWNHRGLHCTVVLLFTWFCICWNNLEAIQMFFFILPIWGRGRRVVKLKHFSHLSKLHHRLWSAGLSVWECHAATSTDMFSYTWSARRHCQSFHAIKNTNSNSNRALLDSRVSGSHVWYFCIFFRQKTAIWIKIFQTS